MAHGGSAATPFRGIAGLQMVELVCGLAIASANVNVIVPVLRIGTHDGCRGAADAIHL